MSCRHLDCAMLSLLPHTSSWHCRKLSIGVSLPFLEGPCKCGADRYPHNALRLPRLIPHCCQNRVGRTRPVLLSCDFLKYILRWQKTTGHFTCPIFTFSSSIFFSVFHYYSSSFPSHSSSFPSCPSSTDIKFCDGTLKSVKLVEGWWNSNYTASFSVCERFHCAWHFHHLGMFLMWNILLLRKNRRALLYES